MHMYHYLALLYLPKYTNLCDLTVPCIILHRKFILLLQRSSLKDVDRAGLVSERCATIPEGVHFKKRLFRFHFCLSRAKFRCLILHFRHNSISTSGRTRRDFLTVEECQMILDYSLWNLKQGRDGRDEIDDPLILLPGTCVG